MENISVETLLRGISNCKCKKDHKVSIQDVIIENDAISKLPQLLEKYNHKNLFLVYDSNTYEVCANKINDTLKDKNFNLSSMIYKRENELTPDEKALSEFIINITPETELIIAVGSGVINDICKYMSYKLNIPYIIVATAPSMDGYASNVSALTINNLKITYTTKLPKAIVGDINILKKAPIELILAGFGDIAGKYSALNDWKLANIVNGEYICEEVYNLVKYSVDSVVNGSNDIKSRSEKGIKNLMESLVLTGIGMSFVGNSRPASGSEHHLSHYLEIQSLFNNIKIPLHGTKVAAGTVLTQKLREKLVNENKELNVKKDNPFDIEIWTKDIKQKYNKASFEVFNLNEKNDTLSQQKRENRLETIKNNKKEIINLLSSGPSSKEIIGIFESIGLDYNYNYIDENMLQDTILYAKDLRDRYTITHLLWDLNLLEEYSKNLSGEYFKKETI